MILRKYKYQLICILIALFPFLGFWQISIISVLGSDISHSFGVSLSKTNNLAAIYTYADALALIPVGLLLDRYRTRTLLFVGLSIFNIGLILFALSPNYDWACISRIIAGVGHAFALMGCFAYIKNHISVKNQTFWFSMVLTIAFIGGIMAQAPTDILLTLFSWRMIVWVMVSLGMALFVLLYFIMPSQEISKQKTPVLNQLGFFFESSKNINNFGWSAFIFLMDIPIMIIGALLGYTYLIHIVHLPSTEASLLTSLIYIGTIFGTPILGYIADKYRNQGMQIILCALISSSCLIGIILFKLPIYAYIILFFFCGFFTSIQGLGYASIPMVNPEETSNTAMSLVNVIVMLTLATLQAGYGYLYNAETAPMIFLSLPILILIGGVIGYAMTYKKNIYLNSNAVK